MCWALNVTWVLGVPASERNTFFVPVFRHQCTDSKWERSLELIKVTPGFKFGQGGLVDIRGFNDLD